MPPPPLPAFSLANVPELLAYEAAIGRQMLGIIGETRSDDEAFDRLNESLAKPNPLNAFIGRFASTPSGQFSCFFGMRWVQAAFASIEVGHKLAAAMCVTGSSPDVAEYLAHAPWPAFIVRPPEGLLLYTAPDGQERSVELIRVWVKQLAEGPRWYIVASVGSQELFEFGLTPEQFADDAPARAYTEDEDPFHLPKAEPDARLSLLVRRLVRGVVLWLIDPARRGEARRPQGTSSAAKKARALKEKTGGPVTDTYVITAPIVVDAREEVRRFLKGERRSPNVRSLVRGHHKMQPYGPEKRLRQYIWIHPYWRGGEELPIAVRPHTMKKDES